MVFAYLQIKNISLHAKSASLESLMRQQIVSAAINNMCCIHQ